MTFPWYAYLLIFIAAAAVSVNVLYPYLHYVKVKDFTKTKNQYRTGGLAFDGGNSTTTVNTTSTTSTTVSSSTVMHEIGSSFVESGLPLNTTWSIIYGGISNSSIGNSIALFLGSGNYSFSINAVQQANFVYYPTPSNGYLITGNSVTVSFSAYNLTTASTVSTSSTTVTTTTSTTNSTVLTTSTIPQNSTLGTPIPKRSKPTTVKPLQGSQKMLIAPQASPFRSLSVVLKSSAGPVSSAGLNISIQNSTAPIGSLPQLQAGNIYQYIEINQSLASNSSSADPYIHNVTYNFVVNQSWINSNSVPPNSVTLFKYSDLGWTPLQTRLTGYNSTAYFYSAVSSSLSGYAVSYISSNAIGFHDIQISMTTGFTTYFYSGSVNSVTTAPTANYLLLTNALSHQGTGFNESIVGYNTLATANIVGGTQSNAVIVGIGANVIFVNNGITKLSNSVVSGTSNVGLNVPFSVNTGGSFVIIATAVGDTILATANFVMPSGCKLQNLANAVGQGSAAIATCNSLAQGTTYSVNTILPKVGQVSTGIWVFPPYNVPLLDYPQTANVLTNGTQQVNGNTVGVIGFNSVNAVLPSGYKFSYWAVDAKNALNISIYSPTSANSPITVMGDGIVTLAADPPFSYQATYSASNAVGTKDTQISAPSGFKTYFYAGADNSVTTLPAANYIVLTNSLSFRGAGFNGSFIGYNTINTANIVGGTQSNGVIVGIGANVVFTNNGATKLSNSLVTGTSNVGLPVTFTVNTAYSYAVIATAVGDTILTTSNFIVPATCFIQNIANAVGQGSAAIATCNDLVPGTYTVNTILPKIGQVSTGIWVFPPYNVMLNDLPGTGNILTNGTTQLDNNVITVIGDNTVNALGFGTNTLVQWYADSANAANFTISSPSTYNTYISVMGDGILNAAYGINGVCTTTINNALLNFGTVAPSQKTSSTQNNVVTVNNGAKQSTLFVEGTAWQFSSSSYLSQNTVWTTNDLGSTGLMTGSFVSTTEPVLGAGANTLYFGASVPGGTAIGNFIQTITIESSC